MTLALPDGTGAHRVAAQLAAAFRREGHRVVLLCGPGSKADVDPLLLGDSEAPPAGDVTVLRHDGFRRALDWSLVSEIQRVVSREAVDCLVAFQQADRKYAALAARRAGIPFVIHAGNQHAFWGPWPVPPLKAQLYGWLLRRCADLIVCTSEAVQAEFVERFRVPAERTCVQPNGIDVHGLARPGARTLEGVRRELGVGPRDVLLLNAGRLDVQKGQDLLLRAFAPIAASRPDVKLALVGAVPGSRNRRRMERFAKELRDFAGSRGLGAQVVFTGWRDDVQRLLAAADLYVHSARWEGPALCLSVLEAMAAALPVISTDCSGHPAGFQNGRHGFIVASGAVRPLREAVERILALTREQRRAMGAGARALAVERYDSRVSSARCVALVEDLLSSGRGRAGASRPRGWEARRG
jgi:glycosyltransferase involved in cell wall biosynthesis